MENDLKHLLVFWAFVVLVIGISFVVTIDISYKADLKKACITMQGDYSTGVCKFNN